MNETSKGPRYLMRWDHSRDQQLARDVVVTSHRLGELDWLFGQRVAEVIDTHPRSALTLRTISDDPSEPAQYQYGELGRFGGDDVIDMIRRGRLWLTMADLQVHHPALRQVVDRLFGELRECHPGLRTFGETGQLQISSPSTRAICHAERGPNIHWNIQGSRRVWIYPNRERFLSPETLDEVILGRQDAPCRFDASLDIQARVLDLLPGQMISIPQYLPYRIENTDNLNVTLVTGHMTWQAERQNNVLLANQMLRSFLPSVADEDRITGCFAVLKDVMVRLMRRDRRSCTAQHTEKTTFVLDPFAPNFTGPINTEHDVADATQLPTLTSLGIETTPSAAWEN